MGSSPRIEASPAGASNADLAILLAITALFDLFDHAARIWRPAEMPRAPGAHPAVRRHGVFGSALAPFGCRLHHRHRRRRALKAQHSVDGIAKLAHRILAALHEIERSGWSL